MRHISEEEVGRARRRLIEEMQRFKEAGKDKMDNPQFSGLICASAALQWVDGMCNEEINIIARLLRGEKTEIR